MFSPTKEALTKAVKQYHLTTCLGLKEYAINKYLKLTPATVMGHMNQKRQNIRSTSKEVKITSDLEDTTVTPPEMETKHIWFIQWLLIKVRFTLTYLEDFLKD
jgi:hypothetical protein